ncbi:MAG: hypothetical protein CSA95_07750 [Bacteroidetes bacterium]|nr:MAG: hypothetical protein CSA95_07750 [Bacteroidota bacterium]PIE88717.1 MAG: hypothetical protein CSA04_00465 [Bacteroidota bacterium]
MSLFAEGDGKSHLFDLDESALEVQFEELSVLENFVLENGNVTAISLKDNGFDMAGYAFNTNMTSDLDFQWEGFLWGFLCCPVGFFVIAIDKDETRDNKISFWIGVGAGVVLSAITSPIYLRYYYH